MKKSDIEKIKLTPRQWKLYLLVKHNTYQEHRKTTLEEIVEKYNQVFHEDNYVMRETNHDKCVSVRNDIDKINLSSEVQRIIVVYDDYSYKLAESEEEVLNMLYRLYYQPAFSKLVKASRIKYKASKDKQGRILTNDLKPIYDIKNDKLEKVSKKAKAFVEVFEDYENTEETASSDTSEKEAQ